MSDVSFFCYRSPGYRKLKHTEAKIALLSSCQNLGSIKVTDEALDNEQATSHPVPDKCLWIWRLWVSGYRPRD